MANVFGEVEVTDWKLAALLSCDNYPLVRCLSDGTNSSTTWVFKDIPSCDFEVYHELVAKEDTQVPLLGFVQGLKTIHAAQAHAGRNCGFWSGCWYSRK